MSSKRAGYVYLNDVPTRIVTWGRWIEEPFEYDQNRELILFIPGNPGVTAFYESFLATIYEKVKTPVWIVGHSGHEKPRNPEDYSIPDPKVHRKKFGLDTQINNKMLFIEKYIPADVKIHLVGHSVGTYTILHLLEHTNIKQRVIKSYFLFPTIEYVGDSFNGMIMTKLVRPIVPLIIFLSWIFTILFGFIQKLLVYIYCKVVCVEMELLDAIVKFVDPYVLRNVFTMAYDQLKTVRERPNDKLKKNWDGIKLYYGKIDNWVPNLAPVNIKKDIPDLDVEVCKIGMEHTFVLRHSKEMGDVVAGWLSAN